MVRTKIWSADGGDKSTADHIEEKLIPHMPKICFGDGVDYESDDFKTGVDSDKLEDVNVMLGDLVDLDPRGGCQCVQTVGLVLSGQSSDTAGKHRDLETDSGTTEPRRFTPTQMQIGPTGRE